jgi:hypothetical protein
LITTEYPDALQDELIRVTASLPDQNYTSGQNESQSQLSDLSFDAINLVNTVDEHRIRVRWLESLLPSMDHRPKPYTVGTMAFVARVLKSYPTMFANGGNPPIFHASQLSKTSTIQPLAHCRSIASMWCSRSAQNADLVRQSILQEMTRIYVRRQLCNNAELLAALQAYLMYVIMLFSMSDPNKLDADLAMNLQSLAGDAAGKGTICPAEAQGTRPDWESWIIAAAKRRTLFTTSIFDNLVNFTTGSPSFVAVELASLPAPASKQLWESATRWEWQQCYNEELGHWKDGQLLISDLWPFSKPLTEEQNRRIDQWLLGVDEFGMMIYAVTSHTYKQ